jgi:hypothetical protein
MPQNQMVRSKINGHLKMHALGWKHQVQLEGIQKHAVVWKNAGRLKVRSLWLQVRKSKKGEKTVPAPNFLN